ncbi:MAG: DUF881 domain-containing protein [Solirubrobacterales bacterium]
MRNNEANIFVFAASIIIGILISFNISLSRESSITPLSSSQYMDAYNYKNQLYGEISSLVNQYNKLENKLTSYKASEANNSSISGEINKEINENNMILGKTAVTGEGIIIVLNDADSIYFENNAEDQFRLVHNTDIIQVLNDLRNAGAEAISVNNQRITGTSEIYCWGQFLRINGVKIAAPFTIYAIGNKQVLYDYMMSDENYLKSLMLRKINVNITQSDQVKISAYTASGKTDFMKAESN